MKDNTTNMTAREFFTGEQSPITFDKILSKEEQEFLLDSIELYASGKVRFALSQKLPPLREVVSAEDVIALALKWIDDTYGKNWYEAREKTKWAFVAGFNASLSHTTAEAPSTRATAYFLEYCKDARNEFCAVVSESTGSNKLMTAIDSLLICFDQMKERLEAPQQEHDREVASKAWDASNNFAEEQQRYPYGKRGGMYEYPNKETYINSL